MKWSLNGSPNARRKGGSDHGCVRYQAGLRPGGPGGFAGRIPPYTGKDIETEYLPGWLGNIEREFNELSSDARAECAAAHYEVLRKVAAYLGKFYGAGDANALKAQAMVEVAKGAMDSEG